MAGSYLVIETLNLEPNIGRFIHVLIPKEDKTTFRLGRGHESDVRFRDVSISRFHAQITFSNNEIKIRDLDSKFGTIVMISREIDILPENLCTLQIGRTFLTLRIKKLGQKEPEVIQSTESHRALLEDGMENGHIQASTGNEEEKINREAVLSNWLSQMGPELSPISGNIIDLPEGYLAFSPDIPMSPQHYRNILQ